MKLPSIQFYPGDWFKDLGVQSLTYEEKGIWFEMLMYMFQSEQCGRLVLNGQPMSDEDIGNLLHLEVAKVKQTLKQLLTKGVASKDEFGAIINRRMVNDDKLRKIRAVSGSLGGKQTSSKRQASVKQKSTPSSSSSSSKKSTPYSPAGKIADTSKTASKGKEKPADSPYEITTPLQRVVCGWKVITGNQKDDRVWDKAHFGRTAKTALLLLEFLGNDATKAIDCCQDVYEGLKKKGLDCTIETVLKHSADWRIKDNGGR